MDIKTIHEIAEELGWSTSEDNMGDICEIEFEQHSPAGEDFIFNSSGKTALEIIEDIREYAHNSFDEEEHVTTLLNAKAQGFAGVPDMKTLVEDAGEIHTMLKELADALEKGSVPKKKAYTSDNCFADLESILIALGANKPFLDEMEQDEEGHRQPFTDEGSKAYSLLTKIVYTLPELTGVDFDAEDVVETLDNIASQLHF